jgi:hypothetical protein
MNDRLDRALNRVTMWRSAFAGWQLGTRPKGDPECDAVRDHRELSIALRVEASALARVLIDRGIMTVQEWENAVASEADALELLYEASFPGISATVDGLTFDERAVKTMRGWKP